MNAKILANLLVFTTILSLLTSIKTDAKVGCLDENGKAVDYWVALRLPGPSPRQMVKYDPNTRSLIKLSSENNGEWFLKQQLDTIQASKNSHLAYNDEHPTGPDVSTHGTAHAKGVMASNSSGQGFFLSHSVPKFPDYVRSKYSYITPTSSHYGQHFFCMTITSQGTIDTIMSMLAFEHVSFYENTYKTTNEKLDLGLSSPPITRINKFLSFKTSELLNSSASGDFKKNSLEYSWQMFTKDPSTEILLWDSAVGSTYGDKLLTETWGRPWAEGNCTGDSILVSNISNLTYDSDNTWDDTQDHSKWGVFKDKTYFCVSDMNRQMTQKTRGGSAFCIHDTGLHRAFLNMVNHDSCKFIG